MQKWVEENPNERIRVCRDDIRRMFGPYWIPSREDLVTTIENEVITKALIDNYSVVVDATNFRGIGRFLEMIPSDVADVKLIDHFLDVDLKTCIQRDQQREHTVGKDVIIKMFNKNLNNG